MNNSVDILNLEWPHSDRDRHIVTPVYLYLKKKYNLSIQVENIFQGFSALRKYKPRLLLISNFGGAGINHLLVKYASEAGIKTVSLISEGNVKESVADQFLWGWNKDRVLYADRLLVWTERSKEIFKKLHPELSDRIKVTGGTGFDRYRLLQFLSKSEFLKKQGLEKYEKVIGIAAWGFDHYFGKYFERHRKYYIEKFGLDQIEMHRADLFLIQKIYREIVEKNPEILFILRYHPGTLDYEKNEFFGLESLPNVFCSSRKENWEYKISDLINVSDMWMGYETTTALEAWILNKQTFLINPTRTNFIRENVHKGSPIVAKPNEAMDLIKNYYQHGLIPGFADNEKDRKTIIEDVIGFDDGKNHIRAAEEIYKVLNEPERNIDWQRIPKIKILKQNIRYCLMNILGRPQFQDIKREVEQYEALYRDSINI